jgi:hypothetical protein
MPEAAPFARNAELTAGLWSADSLIAANLQAAYGGGLFAGPAGATSQTQMSREVKDALAEEVKQQIAAEQSAAGKSQATASSGDEVPPALDPNFRYFVVASNLDVTTEDGQECSLTQGDVIERTSDALGEDNSVGVTVRSSKKDDCAVGSQAAVDANELQEMYNQFRALLDAGLKSLAQSSGKGGLPRAPDASTVVGEVPPPTPDANVNSDLQQQEKEADQTEAEVNQGSGDQ